MCECTRTSRTPITDADDGPYKRVAQRTWAGVDQGRRCKGAGGLWQSTQGLEAKRLIPQEALHPVLIRREFYERFERYPLCELGSRREYAPRRPGLYGNIGRRQQDHDFTPRPADYNRPRCFPASLFVSLCSAGKVAKFPAGPSGLDEDERWSEPLCSNLPHLFPNIEYR